MKNKILISISGILLLSLICVLMDISNSKDKEQNITGDITTEFVAMTPDNFCSIYAKTENVSFGEAVEEWKEQSDE